MKYNKGFAPVLVLVIVLGVLAVGGIAYFAGKSSSPKNEVTDNSNYFPPVQQNQNPPVISNTNNNITPPVTIKPSISVLLPKTGDTLVAGSVKVVTWSSTNLTSSDLINIWLIGVGNSQYSKELIHATINDGSESVTIPSQLNDQFELMVQLTNGRDNSGSSYITIIPKDSTSNLKTYTNTKYGFEFKYPVNDGKGGVYKVGEFTNTDEAQFTPAGLSSVHDTVSVYVPERGEYKPTFNVDVRGIVSPPDLYTYAKNKYLFTGGQIQFSSAEYININGTQWLKAKYLENFELNTGPTARYEYIITHNNFYTMSLNGLNYTIDDYKKLGLEGIISTLKFTK